MNCIPKGTVLRRLAAAAGSSPATSRDSVQGATGVAESAEVVAVVFLIGFISL